MHGKHGLGESWTYTAGRLQELEHGLLVLVEEPVQRERILTNDQRRRRLSRLPDPQRRHRAGSALQRQADATDLDDYAIGSQLGLDQPQTRSSAALAGQGGDGGVDPAARTPTPHRADRQRERVGGVHGTRRIAQAAGVG